MTLGAELAGTVEAVGACETELQLGDDVFGATNDLFIGAYAEYAIPSRHKIARKPQSLDYVASASAPTAAVTAWQLLERTARRKGQSVLVHGAAGGVGAYVVQLAHSDGLRVIGTVTGDDAAYVRELGADEVIDVRSNRFEDVAGSIDAVIDLVGGDVQRRSFDVLKPGGSLISPVVAPNQGEAKRRGVRASYLLVDVVRPYLNRIAKLFDTGQLRARVATVLPLAQARCS